MKPAEMKIKVRKVDFSTLQGARRVWWEWRCPYHLMNAPNGDAHTWDRVMYLVNLHLELEHFRPAVRTFRKSIVQVMSLPSVVPQSKAVVSVKPLCDCEGPDLTCDQRSEHRTCALGFR